MNDMDKIALRPRWLDHRGATAHGIDLVGIASSAFVGDARTTVGNPIGKKGRSVTIVPPSSGVVQAPFGRRPAKSNPIAARAVVRSRGWPASSPVAFQDAVPERSEPLFFSRGAALYHAADEPAGPTNAIALTADTLHRDPRPNPKRRVCSPDTHRPSDDGERRDLKQSSRLARPKRLELLTF